MHVYPLEEGTFVKGAQGERQFHSHSNSMAAVALLLLPSPSHVHRNQNSNIHNRGKKIAEYCAKRHKR